jgi:hypothetical protein
MVDTADIIAVLFVIFYILCKFNHIDTAIDASVAMIIAFYFGSKHNHRKR